jgi:hypothetical protein
MPETHGPRGDTPFLGRDQEQDLFSVVLAEAIRTGDSDMSYVVLVYALGGMGKTELLRRYMQIVNERAGAGWKRGKREMLLVSVDWGDKVQLPAAGYVTPGGPPVWEVLDQIYEAVRQAAAASKRDSTAVSKAFQRFRLEMTKVPELAEYVRRSRQGAVSERRTSVAETKAVVQAVGTGAALFGGAPPPVAAAAGSAAKGIVGAGQDLRETLRERRNGPVPDDLYSEILWREATLIDAFADCLRCVSAEIGPVVIVLDACELISGSQGSLLRVMQRSGGNTVWAIGMRSQPEDVSGMHGPVALYRQKLDESRLRLVYLNKFSNEIISNYLSYELEGELPPGVTVGRVAKVTHGIPRAVSLVCELLNAGQDPEIVLSPVPEPGVPSVVIRALAELYLKYAKDYPALKDDLQRLYGLALFYSDRLDPDLLAALWDVAPTEVADVTAKLTERHDFVLYDSHRLPDDIRDTIRLYLLDDLLRAEQRPMNMRAVAHLRHRLARLDLPTADYKIASGKWQSLAAALVWYNFWVDPHSGFRLLHDLLPAAFVLAPSFADVLLETAGFFEPILDKQDKQAILALKALRSSGPAAHVS